MPILPALLTLLFAAGAFATNSSTNDSFRVFSLHASRQPKLPVCCLKPLSPHDPVQDQVLLSFEEWKAKQWDELKEQPKAREHIIGQVHGTDANGSRHVFMDSGNDNKKGESIMPAQNASLQTGSFQSDDFLSQSQQPNFRVPITDRFNYASLDCSARVHTAHRSAKSPSAVLDSKRDRYMLSPCKPASGEKQFIVVELCEDVRIDTVQLANFEFFSGVFKEFSVSVAKTYTTEGEGWADAGTYRAKNVRGVQSFHPPTSLRDFYRYIRIDFRSHYGNEYYCPVSLLRVYGLTHLEEYKREQWEEESRAKMGFVSSAQVHDQQTIEIRPAMAQATESTGETMVPMSTTTPSQQLVSEIQLGRGSASSSIIPDLSLAPTHTQTPILDCVVGSPAKGGQNEPPIHNTHSELSRSPSTTNSDVSLYPITADSHTSTDTPLSISTAYPSTSSRGALSDASSAQSSMHSSSVQSPASSPHTSSHTTSNGVVNIATPSIPVVSQAVTPSTSGESIYRVIMNRLTALEANHTLYARYVEQQNTAVRELLKRLVEDVGRLEGIGRAQGQVHQRTVQEWERQRQQLQMEFRELLAIVEYLSDEVTLEKRLGIAQLCLLLLVLVFIALTRGSRGEPLLVRHDIPGSARSSKYKYWKDWRMRWNLSTDRLRSTSSAEGDMSIPGRISNHSHNDSGSGLDEEFLFPRQRKPLASVDLNLPQTNLDTHWDPGRRTRKPSDHSRPRTPSFRKSVKHNVLHPFHLSPSTHHQHYVHHRTLTRSKSAVRRPALQRSNSHNSEAYSHRGLWPGTPRSGRNSAKSAHLHEVVRTPPARQNGVENALPSTVDAPSHYLSSNRRQRTSSDARLQPDMDVFVSSQQGIRIKGKQKTPMDVGNSDGDLSAWEDTDSIPGE